MLTPLGLLNPCLFWKEAPVVQTFVLFVFVLTFSLFQICLVSWDYALLISHMRILHWIFTMFGTRASYVSVLLKLMKGTPWNINIEYQNSPYLFNLGKPVIWNHWVDASAGRPIVPKVFTSPIVRLVWHEFYICVTSYFTEISSNNLPLE